MIQEIRRLSRAARIRRGFPAWILPLSGSVGLLAALVFALLQK